MRIKVWAFFQVDVSDISLKIAWRKINLEFLKNHEKIWYINDVGWESESKKMLPQRMTANLLPLLLLCLPKKCLCLSPKLG